MADLPDGWQHTSCPLCGGQAHEPVADPLVPVPVAAELALAVVAVDREQAARAAPELEKIGSLSANGTLAFTP